MREKRLSGWEKKAIKKIINETHLDANLVKAVILMFVNAMQDDVLNGSKVILGDFIKLGLKENSYSPVGTRSVNDKATKHPYRPYAKFYQTYKNNFHPARLKGRTIAVENEKDNPLML